MSAYLHHAKNRGRKQGSYCPYSKEHVVSQAIVPFAVKLLY